MEIALFLSVKVDKVGLMSNPRKLFINICLETLLEDDCKVDNLLVECADKSVILVFKRRGMKIILP